MYILVNTGNMYFPVNTTMCTLHAKHQVKYIIYEHSSRYCKCMHSSKYQKYVHSCKYCKYTVNRNREDGQ